MMKRTSHTHLRIEIAVDVLSLPCVSLHGGLVVCIEAAVMKVLVYHLRVCWREGDDGELRWADVLFLLGGVERGWRWGGVERRRGGEGVK